MGSGITPTIGTCPAADDNLQPLTRGVMVLKSKVGEELKKYPADTEVKEAPRSTANQDADPTNDNVLFVLRPHDDTEAVDFYTAAFPNKDFDGLCKTSDSYQINPDITQNSDFTQGKSAKDLATSILLSERALHSVQAEVAQKNIHYDLAKDSVAAMEKTISPWEILLADASILWTGHRIFGTEVPRATTMWEQHQLREGSGSRAKTELQSRKESFDNLLAKNNLCFAEGVTILHRPLVAAAAPRISTSQLLELGFITAVGTTAVVNAWPEDAAEEEKPFLGKLIIGETQESLEQKTLPELKERALALKRELEAANAELTLLDLKMAALDRDRIKPNPTTKLVTEGLGGLSALASLVLAFGPLAHSAQKRFQATSPRVKALQDTMKRLHEAQQDLAKQEIQRLVQTGQLRDCSVLAAEKAAAAQKTSSNTAISTTHATDVSAGLTRTDLSDTGIEQPYLEAIDRLEQRSGETYQSWLTEQLPLWNTEQVRTEFRGWNEDLMLAGQKYGGYSFVKRYQAIEQNPEQAFLYNDPIDLFCIRLQNVQLQLATPQLDPRDIDTLQTMTHITRDLDSSIKQQLATEYRGNTLVLIGAAAFVQKGVVGYQATPVVVQILKQGVAANNSYWFEVTKMAAGFLGAIGLGKEFLSEEAPSTSGT